MHPLMEQSKNLNLPTLFPVYAIERQTRNDKFLCPVYDSISTYLRERVQRLRCFLDLNRDPAHHIRVLSFDIFQLCL
ncbi:hypothetical protein SAMN02745704_00533 [Paucidesulfovibrio gracilis DSM 16080]|uniref:Uncharacterized protein n=1 Tax=Paucidesulfovibrio gracilis DSM 16080 TaxID=1121449 RepID=A0A1T4W959_9BACT|nr:hypothetical protein SAMN02745704_00533 [Paucidesulfovibrio gracilis DSM 16080]